MMRAATVLTAMVMVTACLAVPTVEKPKESKAAQVRNKLLQPVSIPEIEGHTPAKEALDFLSEKFEITYLIDTEAFKTDLMIHEPQHQPVKLPKMEQVRLHTILRMALGQLQADYYVAADGVVHIVPQPTVVRHQLKQAVQVKFDKRPLQEALQELQELSGFNIVLDVRRAADNARAPVSVQLNGVTLESAVIILADLAELKPILIDNVYYITTAANAAEMQKEQDRKRGLVEGGVIPPQQ